MRAVVVCIVLGLLAGVLATLGVLVLGVTVASWIAIVVAALVIVAGAVDYVRAH